jgi:hypothetical protein
MLRNPRLLALLVLITSFFCQVPNFSSSESYMRWEVIGNLLLFLEKPELHRLLHGVDDNILQAILFSAMLVTQFLFLFTFFSGQMPARKLIVWVAAPLLFTISWLWRLYDLSVHRDPIADWETCVMYGVPFFIATGLLYRVLWKSRAKVK